MTTAAMKRNRLMTPAQCRAARALLNWTQMRLAQQARVVRMTVTMFEAGGTVRASTRRRIQAACEQAGVSFVWSEADGGEGAMLTKPVPRKPYLWRYAFDRKFYQAQARLIAALASDPALTDIRDGLLALVYDYKAQAERLGSST